VFRFNRRNARGRGLVFHRVLDLAARHEPVHYRDLIADPQPTKRPPDRRRRMGASQPLSSSRRPTAPGEGRLTEEGPVEWIPPNKQLMLSRDGCETESGSLPLAVFGGSGVLGRDDGVTPT
jgi:hypothetical protein